MDVDAPQVNPDRVPDTIARIDGPQAGAPRIIHPVAMQVGVTGKDHEMVSRFVDRETFEVPKDGTYLDRRGNPIAFRKGDKLSLSRAAEFPDFDVSLEGKHLPGLSNARSDGAAPENRMESPPENRGDDSATEDPLGELSNDAYAQLSPPEKGARTRQFNEQQDGE